MRELTPYQWIGPTPTGSEIFVHPTVVTEIPENGFDIEFGPDIARRLHHVRHVYCEKHSKSKCIDKLTEVLEHDHKALKKTKRQLGAAIELGGALIAAAYAYEGPAKNPEASNKAHLPSEAVSQLDAKPSATNVVFKSGADDKHPVTYHGDPSKTETAHVSVRTIQSNKGKYHKGDIVVQIPEDVAHFLQRTLDKNDKCDAMKEPHHQHSRRDPLEPNPPVAEGVQINEALRQAMEQADGVMPVHQMVQAGQHHLANLPLGRLNLPDAEQHAQDLVFIVQNEPVHQMMRQLNAEQRKFAVKVMFTYTFFHCIGQIAEVTTFVLKKATGHHGTDKCPDDAPKGINAPLCSHCKGGEEMICHEGKWKGCKCLFQVSLTGYRDSREYWHERERILQKAFRHHEHHEEPKTQCDKAMITVGTDSFKQ
jgi:hypothetical protein